MPSRVQTLTCIAFDSGGQPIAGANWEAVLLFRNDRGDWVRGCGTSDGHVVGSSLIAALSGQDGIAKLALVPNGRISVRPPGGLDIRRRALTGESCYRLTAYNPDEGARFVRALYVMPDQACQLHELQALGRL